MCITMCCNFVVFQANGFYGARGIAGHVPSMYVYFANRFLKKTLDQQKKNIKYFEYYRPGWTFHGKGIMYCVF